MHAYSNFRVTQTYIHTHRHLRTVLYLTPLNLPHPTPPTVLQSPSHPPPHNILPLSYPHPTAVAEAPHGTVNDLVEDFKKFTAHSVNLRGLPVVQPSIVNHQPNVLTELGTRNTCT